MKRKYYIALPSGKKVLYSQTRNKDDVEFIEQELDEAALDYTWEEV